MIANNKGTAVAANQEGRTTPFSGIVKYADPNVDETKIVCAGNVLTMTSLEIGFNNNR